VDVITGGEVFTDGFLGHLPRRLRGIAPVLAPGGQAGRRFYRLAGRLEAPTGIGYAAAFQRESEIEEQLGKATCPGPMTLLSFLLLADPSAYSALADAVAIVNREVREIARAGAREIQLDLPGEVAAVVLWHHDVQEVARAIAAAFQGARSAVRTAHLCCQGLRVASVGAQEKARKLVPLIRELEGQVDRLLLECADADSLELLRAARPGAEVVAGIGSVAGSPEPVDVLVGRGRAVLQWVPAEKVFFSTECGLRHCSGPQAVGIVTNVVAAARRLSV
jgi:methionine synthase II (cobalamin-independent)